MFFLGLLAKITWLPFFPVKREMIIPLFTSSIPLLTSGISYNTDTWVRSFEFKSKSSGGVEGLKSLLLLPLHSSSYLAPCFFDANWESLLSFCRAIVDSPRILPRLPVVNKSSYGYWNTYKRKNCQTLDLWQGKKDLHPSPYRWQVDKWFVFSIPTIHVLKSTQFWKQQVDLQHQLDKDLSLDRGFRTLAHHERVRVSRSSGNGFLLIRGRWWTR